MNLARRHHIVPRSYLRFFTDRSGQLSVFDKDTNKRYITSTKNVAIIRDFYRDTVISDPLKWESFYANNVELFIPTIFEEIIKISMSENSGSKILDSSIKDKLALIICTQQLRSIAVRQLWQKYFTPNNLQTYLILENKIEHFVQNIKSEKISLNNLYRAIIKNSMLELNNHCITISMHTELLKDRTWIIFRYNQTEKRILTCDNPVIAYNYSLQSYSLDDNDYLNSKSLILFPLCPFCFIMIIPYNCTELEGFQKYKNCVLNASALIIFHNQSQLQQAYRQVFSHVDNSKFI